ILILVGDRVNVTTLMFLTRLHRWRLGQGNRPVASASGREARLSDDSADRARIGSAEPHRRRPRASPVTGNIQGREMAWGAGGELWMVNTRFSGGLRRGGAAWPALAGADQRRRREAGEVVRGARRGPGRRPGGTAGAGRPGYLRGVARQRAEGGERVRESIRSGFPSSGKKWTPWVASEQGIGGVAGDPHLATLGGRGARMSSDHTHLERGVPVERIRTRHQRRGGGGEACGRSRRLRPTVMELEGRALLSTLTVSNTDDSGAGSLRAAVAQANADGGGDTIVFSSLFNAPQTITLSGQLELTGTTGTTTIT